MTERKKMAQKSASQFLTRAYYKGAVRPISELTQRIKLIYTTYQISNY